MLSSSSFPSRSVRPLRMLTRSTTNSRLCTRISYHRSLLVCFEFYFFSSILLWFSPLLFFSFPPFFSFLLASLPCSLLSPAHFSPLFLSLLTVGNKADLVDEREVNTAEGQKLAEGFGAIYLETSAKTGQNIDTTFEKLVDMIRDRATSKGGGTKTPEKKKRFCCIV